MCKRVAAWAMVFFSAVPLVLAEARSAAQVLNELSKTVIFGSARISPDGARVAWTEQVRNPDGSESRKTEIYVAALADIAHPRRISAGDGKQAYAENELAWAPDSRTLFFLSDREQARQPQLYSVAVTSATAAKKLTWLKGDLSSPRVSPDGQSVAFLFLENAQAVGPLDAYTPETGVMESAIHEQRLAILTLATGAVASITPANLFVYEFDWAPDSRQLAYTGAEGDGDNNWWIARLFRIDIASRQQSLVAKPVDQIAEPRWSPDGESIAFVGGLMSDAGVTGGDVYLVPATGGSLSNLTPNRSASATWLRWLPGSVPKLLVGDLVDGGSAISELNPQNRVVERLWQGDEAISFGDVANDGRTSAAIRSSFEKPPELWAGKLGSWSPVTRRNAGLQAPWGKTEKLHWTNQGHRVEGWLLYPSDFNPAQRYPMVVSIHGGPASQLTSTWPQSGYATLATQGMFVFYPNPVGSYGEGESFTRANVKDFGYGDLSDILAGVDQVLKQAPVDAARLGVGGWSYGGFMTMWTVTQTQRFKAAVAGAGIANWQSYYGQNLIDQWMLPYFGASVYDDPAVYARSSPINFIKQTKTPTLIVVGERDAECPMPQSREFWHALKALGVETQLVVYPNEGHHFRDPAHIADLSHRTIDWFTTHLK